MPEIKLDLGAGHKREEGWTSVDLISRDSHPDIIADITKKLPFPDNYADEIRAIHVVEHFPRIHISRILTEWVRVLKPGAMIALECPDLIKAIYFVMTKPTNHPMGLWALYGDPHEDDYMIHKWCYTVPELGNIMKDVGLVDLKEEPAKFHIPYRDMRIIGFKKNAE